MFFANNCSSVSTGSFSGIQQTTEESYKPLLGSSGLHAAQFIHSSIIVMAIILFTLILWKI